MVVGLVIVQGLKFLLSTYRHSRFLAATLDFTSFFTMAFLGVAHFFYSLAFLDKSLLLFVCCKAGILSLMVVVTFSLCRQIFAVLPFQIVEGFSNSKFLHQAISNLHSGLSIQCLGP